MSASEKCQVKSQVNTEKAHYVQLTGGSNSHYPNHFRSHQSQKNIFRITFLVNVIVWALCLVLLYPLNPALAQKSRILTEGIDYYRAGDFRQAIASFSDEIRKNPKSADAYNLRGLTYDAIGKLQEAESDFSAAIKISPNFADAFNNRGEVYRKLGNNRKALADYRMAIRHEKTFADPHYNSALVYESMGDYKKAAASYKEYLKLKPSAKDKSKIEAKIAQLAKMAPQKRPEPTRRVTRQSRAGVQPSRQVGVRQTTPRPGTQGMSGGMDLNEILGQLGVSPQDQQKWLVTILRFGKVGQIISLVSGLLFYVMLFLIARKTRTPYAWVAFIPIGITQLYLMLSIARKPMSWFILFLLPVIAAIAAFMVAPMDPTGGYLPIALVAISLLIFALAWLLVCIGMARMRGKSPIWGVICWLPCISILGFLYLGLSR